MIMPYQTENLASPYTSAEIFTVKFLGTGFVPPEVSERQVLPLQYLETIPSARHLVVGTGMIWSGAIGENMCF